MARGLFVTGTDTGVGKTVISAALLARYRHEFALRYWKPIQTGIEQDDDTAEVRRLARCGPDEVRTDGVRLPRPVSPHLAARLAGQLISLATLALPIESGGLSDAMTLGPRWIVEGAGGVLVPVNDTDLMIDLMVRLALPVVVVTRSTLGTINHTLLTLAALRARTLTIGGIVMVGPPNAENRRAIEGYGRASVLGELPWFEPLTPAAVDGWATAHLDRQGRLSEWLR